MAVVAESVVAVVVEEEEAVVAGEGGSAGRDGIQAVTAAV